MENSPRFLVTGASGQIGREFALQLGIDGIPQTREKLDITNEKLLLARLELLKPDAVIHAAGFTDVAQAEREPDKCWFTNVVGTTLVLNACIERAIPFLFVSDAAIFGTSSNKSLAEDSMPKPNNEYAASKLAAEHVILSKTSRVSRAAFKQGFRHWIVRTVCTYERPWRPNNKNFVLNILTTSNGRAIPFPLPDDVIRNPTYIPHFVKSSLWMIRNKGKAPSGIYHIAGEGSASLFDIGSYLTLFTERPLNISKTSRCEYLRQFSLPEKIVQPHSTLNMDKFQTIYPNKLKNWRLGLKSFCKQLDAADM